MDSSSHAAAWVLGLSLGAQIAAPALAAEDGAVTVIRAARLVDGCGGVVYRSELAAGR